MTLTIRDLEPAADAAVLHRWLTHPKSRYWQLLEATEEQVRAEYERIAANPYQDAYLGLHDGQPAFLVERYDPRHVELAGLFDARDGDVGMHFLCAPTDRPVHGFTLDVITAVLTWLFADPSTTRVVVEPDVRNTAVHRLNAAVGFEVLATLTMPEKEALLSVCTRAQFLTAIGSRA